MRRRLLQTLHTLYEYAALYVGIALLGILCLVWTPFAIVLTALLPNAHASAVGKWAITSGFRIYVRALSLMRAFRFDLRALDALRDEPPMIIAPNHPGLIDAVLVISRLPAACIMKAELERNFFLGAGARFAGYIGNGSVYAMIDRSIAVLRAGAHLLLFPEGTRTTRSPVNAFTGSIGIIARYADVPVQTVIIETDSPYLSKGWPLLRKPALPITYRIRLGRRFDPPVKSRELVGELERYFAAELSRGSMMNSWLPKTDVMATRTRLAPGQLPDDDGEPSPLRHPRCADSQL
ncbi:MAG: lysophospholipid acyltransferase family protein [Betaproteobacteria bacterium]